MLDDQRGASIGIACRPESWVVSLRTAVAIILVGFNFDQHSAWLVNGCEGVRSSGGVNWVAEWISGEVDDVVLADDLRWRRCRCGGWVDAFGIAGDFERVRVEAFVFSGGLAAVAKFWIPSIDVDEDRDIRDTGDALGLEGKLGLVVNILHHETFLGVRFHVEVSDEDVRNLAPGKGLLEIEVDLSAIIRLVGDNDWLVFGSVSWISRLDQLRRHRVRAVGRCRTGGRRSCWAGCWCGRWH
mmetsp:Transcript_19852/g.56158  ORF Transcript_19852/g.56158 Transcript_19852/m.56158 type:complete len:241 (-) Transcript_19852:715-1437(-)